jgi:hypothetical protein
VIREILNVPGRVYQITKWYFESLIGWRLQSGSLILKFIFLSGDFERNMIFTFDCFIIRNGVTVSASPNIPRSGSFLAIRFSPVQGEITEKPIEERKHRPVSGVFPYLVNTLFQGVQLVPKAV